MQVQFSVFFLGAHSDYALLSSFSAAVRRIPPILLWHNYITSSNAGGDAGEQWLHDPQVIQYMCLLPFFFFFSKEGTRTLYVFQDLSECF